MVLGKFITDEKSINLAGGLRKEIFQGRYVTDAFPYPDARYALFRTSGIPAGMGGIRYINHRFTIIELGILEEYRLQYYGDFLLRFMADAAIDDHIKKIYVNATEESKDFFLATHFVFDGEPYESLGQIRFPMVLNPDDLRCVCSRNQFNPYRGV